MNQPGGQLLRFAAAGIAALVIVGLTTLIASRRLGEREAVTEARTDAVVKAVGIVEPAITDELLAGDPAAVAALDEIVRTGVLDESLVRVKVWTGDGTIVYSDVAALVGTTWDLGEEERAVLTSGQIKAEVSDLSGPENLYERPAGKLLEVYLPVRGPDGTPLLFESYFRYDLVERSGSRLWRTFAPLTLGALLFLELVQLPLAWGLTRRLRQRHREREGLLERAIEASDVERRQIASDLHDGTVQDLAGTALSLSAAARRDGIGPDHQRLLDESAAQIREAVKSLRSLIVDLYPPDFDELPFESALTDLLARASERGIAVELDTSALTVAPSRATARLLYRSAQEAVRNAMAHAEPTSITMTLSSPPGATVLTVADDGRGFHGDELARRRAEGHVGLGALRGLVADAGGSLEVTSTPGTGTVVRVEVPQ